MFGSESAKQTEGLLGVVGLQFPPAQTLICQYPQVNTFLVPIRIKETVDTCLAPKSRF